MTKEYFKKLCVDAGLVKVDKELVAEKLCVSQHTIANYLKKGCDKNSHIEKLKAEAERIKNAT